MVGVEGRQADGEGGWEGKGVKMVGREGRRKTGRRGMGKKDGKA